MFAAKVLLKDAERKRQQLLAQSMVNTNFRAHREGEFFYIPLKKKMQGCVEHTFEEKMEKNMLEKELDTLLSSKEKEMLPRSQEIVGDIIILEIPDELKKKEKKIAEIFLRANKSIRTVVKKKDIHGGTFRTRTVEVLAGKNKKETIHRESGCLLKVNIEKMYFSARLAHERLRIAEQVKKKERVLVMFSGCAPYVCVISKKSGADVTGIEINKIAHEYAVENVRMNKVKADLYCGDVKKVLKKLIDLVQPGDTSDWLKTIDQWKKEHPLRYKVGNALRAQYVIHKLGEITKGNAIVVILHARNLGEKNTLIKKLLKP